MSSGLFQCFALVTVAAFSKEMEKAKLKKMNYDFSYFLLISKTYKLGKLPKKGKKKKISAQDTLTFVNAEEELFFKAS